MGSKCSTNLVGKDDLDLRMMMISQVRCSTQAFDSGRGRYNEEGWKLKLLSRFGSDLKKNMVTQLRKTCSELSDYVIRARQVRVYQNLSPPKRRQVRHCGSQ